MTTEPSTTTMTGGDDREAIVLPQALLINKAAPLDALEGICSVTVFFTVDDLGSHIVETDVRGLAGPCTLPGVGIQHTLSDHRHRFRRQKTSLRNAL